MYCLFLNENSYAFLTHQRTKPLMGFLHKYNHHLHMDHVLSSGILVFLFVVDFLFCCLKEKKTPLVSREPKKESDMMNGGAGSCSLMEVAYDHGGKELHVLAVDDNLLDRKLVEKLLKTSSCKVTTAENGLRALEYLGLGDEQCTDTSIDNVSKVNLIITDYCMPGMTGFELLKRVKESSNLREVPVVIMSSDNIPTRINKCLEEGAQMYILKPLKLSDVRELKYNLMNCRG